MGWKVGAEGDHKWEESRMFHQDLVRPLGMKAESEERPQQVDGYRAGGETGGLDLEEQRGRSAYLPQCYLILLKNLFYVIIKAN